MVLDNWGRRPQQLRSLGELSDSSRRIRESVPSVREALREICRVVVMGKREEEVVDEASPSACSGGRFVDVRGSAKGSLVADIGIRRVLALNE